MGTDAATLGLLITRGSTVCGDGSSWCKTTETAAVLPYCEYSHVTLVKRHKLFTIYVNGAEVAEVASPGWSERATGSTSKIGDNEKHDHSRNGLLRSIKVWKGYALSKNEVKVVHTEVASLLGAIGPADPDGGLTGGTGARCGV